MVPEKALSERESAKVALLLEGAHPLNKKLAGKEPSNLLWFNLSANPNSSGPIPLSHKEGMVPTI